MTIHPHSLAVVSGSSMVGYEQGERALLNSSAVLRCHILGAGMQFLALSCGFLRNSP
ncbi:hypothetical protein P7K49_040737, partial [Saguinus oedipus]